jgi:predicted nucleic acid-binding protein
VKAFFDASVLVGAFYGDHPQHAACLELLAEASKKTHFCAAHAVAELYAVMTRLPVRPRITPEQGLLFVENARDYFSVITLSAAEQFGAAAGGARRGPGDGKAYDLFTLECAVKAGAARVYALKLVEIKRPASPELRSVWGRLHREAVWRK